jgi:two-component system nitrate/nitrite response regulator NarL
MNTEPRTAKHVEPIRLLLVEDHEHVLWGLGKLIDGEWPRLQIVGTARTVAQALAAVAAERPDVVVLDLFLGEDSMLDRLPSLQASGAAIVVLTGARDPQVHRRALQAGAYSIVLKERPAEVLLHEIERASAWRATRRREQDCQSAVVPE